MKIYAKFIGTNSLGYVNGQSYKILISGMMICRGDGTGKCIYSSIESFLKNWEL